MKHLLLALGMVLLPRTLAFAEEPITEKNWQTHPRVREVRAIQSAISQGVKRGRYRRATRQFDVEAEVQGCKGLYPVLRKAAYRDAQGRVALYHVDQVSFDDELVRFDYFYDTHGTLRFYLQDRVLSAVRVYFDKDGKHFLTVDSMSAPELQVSTEETWEVGLHTAADALDAFRSAEPCPENRKR